jgi:hypothetical protein
MPPIIRFLGYYLPEATSWGEQLVRRKRRLGHAQYRGY